MKGRAPNCPSIGSQVVVRKKARPNLCRGRMEPCQSSRTSKMEMSTTVAANKKVNKRAISSPSRRRKRNEREPAPGRDVDVVATLLNVGQSLLFFSDDFLGEPRVRKSFGEILSVVQHPGDKALQGIAL